MTRRTLASVTTVCLLLTLFLERYCFIVTVYKAKSYTFVLILIVIALHTAFNFILSRMKTKDKKKRIHEMFRIERTPEVSTCSVGAIG